MMGVGGGVLFDLQENFIFPRSVYRVPQLSWPISDRHVSIVKTTPKPTYLPCFLPVPDTDLMRGRYGKTFERFAFLLEFLCSHPLQQNELNHDEAL